MDPMTAYPDGPHPEGVVERGTATVLRDLNRPLFGKTGTTSGPTNVWFIGGTPTSSPASISATTSRGRWAAMRRAAARRADLQAIRARPRSRTCRWCRSARRRASAWSGSTAARAARCSAPGRPRGSQGGGDLGSLQARKRAAPLDPPRGSRLARRALPRAAAAAAAPPRPRAPRAARRAAAPASDFLQERAASTRPQPTAHPEQAHLATRARLLPFPSARPPGTNGFKGVSMRAEAQAYVDQINAALALLRRFLDWDRALRRLDELNARSRIRRCGTIPRPRRR
jgi:membrane peptidoglycan carboxypeptidase